MTRYRHDLDDDGGVIIVCDEPDARTPDVVIWLDHGWHPTRPALGQLTSIGAGGLLMPIECAIRLLQSVCFPGMDAVLLG